MTMTIVIIVLSFVVALVIAVPMLMKARKAFGPSKKDVETINQLMATGAKARATVLAVTPTGMIVNNINIGCRVDFSLQPLDGTAPFGASKEMFLMQTNMPRMGDTWPAWYDRANPAVFAVGQPGPPTPDQLAIFAEFGIKHPLAG
ncbi:MAG: hypothetical protein KDB35_08145 [Acidimicrobiales bacterium]|nr:hypothetical protein [Acidimicrobiales bacterium]MCB1248766.1 hypothetical protein [Acidimicrobiales bacterium]MCB1261114.1 hypothetical protein [Acidimicrobiales bacterium]